ncbi:hypothetical protein VPNG_06633 [Cytospora leucostoma]|uniref:FAD-binding PCMH-type domain-containing protein n=1 Tax=Cytospora leucostoma TaxID=1230097 RepID=A0A423WV19_9PEZI|nr:hypothetical protein VPNG_06633 [Cytospora leucostoma]
MSQWLSEQYSTLREQVSAAGRALGPLRLTKVQLLRLFIRKTLHDLRLHLYDVKDTYIGTKPVAWVTLIALIAGTIFIVTRQVRRFSSAGRRPKLPTVQMHKGWDYPTLLEQAAKKYPDSPYIITYSGYEYVVFPSSAFDEIRRLNASRASMLDWFTQVFWQGWHFLGTDNSARYHMVGIDLARALPSRIWMRQDHACAAFEAVLGPSGSNKEWTPVSLWGTVQKVVSIMNATGLLGPQLGVDPRWVKATQRLHTAIMVGIVGSHITPRVLRPLVAPIVFLPAKIVDWHMATLLRPMVKRELEEFRAKGHPEKKTPVNGIISSTTTSRRENDDNNGVQQSVNEKFPLTAWLLDRYRSPDGALKHLLRDYIVIAFEAATTSAGMLYFLLAELATRPELVQELREELKQNMDQKGHLPLSYLAELRKMDSFMLESARVTGSSHLALFRRVQKPLRLSIGPELPRGTLICVDAYHAAKSQTKYEDAATLDPLRFYRMRQQPGHEDMHQFTTPGPDNTIWGGGTQACPGRPFASITIKIVLAHLLLHYDVQLLPDGVTALIVGSTLGYGSGVHCLGLDSLSRLNATLDGRVQQARPLAYPCFEDPGGAECETIQDGLLNEYVRASTYNGFMNMQGEACSADPDDQCLLDPETLAAPTNASCGQGTVSPYYVAVRDEVDVQAVFEYARQPDAAILTIKNTGVDHNMRSSRRGSLAIWTHELQTKVFHSSFLPTGSSNSDDNTTAITLGTGVSASDGLIFAHQYGHIIAVANDARPAIGGGWALNGGHGVLASAHGLGADNLLQVTIVTPDGQIRTANRYKDQDLFWALRGAGGGAFGVVLNVTIRAYADSQVTKAMFAFPGTSESMRGYANLLAENLPDWALLGWGGASDANLSVLSNSLIHNTSEAAAQLATAVNYVEAQEGGSVSFQVYPSFYEYFIDVINGTLAKSEPISTTVLYTNRVVPVSVVKNATARAALVDAVLNISTTGLTYGILANMPLLYGSVTPDPGTSLHPAWYQGGVYLVAYAGWESTTALSERKEAVSLLQNATALLNSVAPEGATYSNEADPWMEGWAQAFWGDNYAKLIAVKASVDPDGLLSCWHCVGWDKYVTDTCISGLAS